MNKGDYFKLLQKPKFFVREEWIFTIRDQVCLL